MQTNTRELCAFICHLGARAYPPRSDVSRRGRIIAAGVGRRGPFVCRRHELGRVDREGLLHDHGGAPLAPPREELPGAWVEHGHGGGPRLLRHSLPPRRRHDAHLRHGIRTSVVVSAAARSRI